jgi:hypothetical protein
MLCTSLKLLKTFSLSSFFLVVRFTVDSCKKYEAKKLWYFVDCSADSLTTASPVMNSDFTVVSSGISAKETSSFRREEIKKKLSTIPITME